MASESGSAADGKPSTIRWRSDVQDNSRTTGQHRAMTTASASSSTTAGGAGSGGRRKWSLRGAGRRGSGDGRGGRGGRSALLGHLDDDDLDSDLFDDELDFRHQHDTTSVLFLSPSIPPLSPSPSTGLCCCAVLQSGRSPTPRSRGFLLLVGRPLKAPSWMHLDGESRNLSSANYRQLYNPTLIADFFLENSRLLCPAP